MKPSFPAFLRQVWTHLIRPYWTSEERWIAAGLLGGHVALMGLYIALTVYLNYWNNDFFTALQELNKSAFFHLLGIFCILACFAIVFYTSKFYLLQNLEIRWRTWMTQHLLQHWMKDKRYYTLQLQGDGSDNPDQRIADDIRQFIDNSLNLSLSLLEQTVTLFSFLGILWSLSGTLHIPLGSLTLSIPGYMCWGALLYAIFGTFVSFYLGRSLIGLNYEHEKREANFRYSLVRFRENMEGIAFYQGEGKEQRILASRFEHVAENFYAIIRRMLAMNSWNSFYGQLQYLFPFLLAAPRFFAKEITFGGLTQTMSAFTQVSTSLSFIITNFPLLMSWRATTNRLLEFKVSLENLPPSPLVYTKHQKEAIEVACDHISLPLGSVLKEDLKFTFKRGEDTLITGPTGVGKSTFARVIAGLWPYGKGDVKLPSSSLLFLPQKPYMPLGSLEDVLQYPASKASQEDIYEGLDSVGLSGFKSRLSEVNDWARVLSLGEQQRIAIVRVLLAKPQWLFMDEATSAMDEASESHLYRLLKSQLQDTTFISIGHRESLKALHTREIWLGDTPALSVAV
ncbi:MAG: ABC transporter ATP-binding protein/permease [Proteobacteria bacterium]|nr:ABC transporter ATP-binding protein/permease [Pseudomonadota bacterium]